MKPLILTMGEPAGIGSEITAQAWRLLRLSGLRPVPALLGKQFGATRFVPVP